MKETLLVFTRFPEPGKTKTRLIPGLGAKGAARQQEIMTGWMLLQAKRWAHSTDRSIHVLVTGAPLRRFAQWLGKDLTFIQQADGDLGNRMHQAFTHAFNEGAEKVLVVGVDCPELSSDVLDQATRALDDCDVALYPADDGGYVMLGLKEPRPELFQNIEWGTDQVLRQTRERLKDAGVSVVEGPVKHDVDEPEDLDVWNRCWGEKGTGRVSVVIPALNEEKGVAAAIESAKPDAYEIIVVDGGSQDNTGSVAKQAGARVIESAKGRGRQQNAGARIATGDILVFLHADSSLPEGYADILQGVLSSPKHVLGAFSLSLRDQKRSFRWVEKGVQLRSRWFGLPFGDQAFFLRREDVVRMGGFSQEPLLEDVNLVKKAKRRGKVVTVSEQVFTSTRRWRKLGIVRTTLINQAILIAHGCGVSSERLGKWYGIS